MLNNLRITKYKNGISYKFNNRRVTVYKKDNEFYFEFRTIDKEKEPRVLSYHIHDKLHITRLGLTNEATMALLEILIELIGNNNGNKSIIDR